MHRRSMLTEFLHDSGMFWEWWGESILLCILLHSQCVECAAVDTLCVCQVASLIDPAITYVSQVSWQHHYWSKYEMYSSCKFKNNKKKKKENTIENSVWTCNIVCVSSLNSHTKTLWLTQPVTEMSTTNSSWGVKSASAQGWKFYQLHVPIVWKSVNLSILEPSVFLQACNCIAYFTNLNKAVLHTIHAQAANIPAG